MSLAVLYSRALEGIHAPLVTVEAHLGNGLPSFTIVGLPEAEVRESRERVRSAIQNSRFEFPAKRITINLAPADLPKESGRFDLPIALGILAASGQIPADQLNRYEFAGELALDGHIRHIKGALTMVYSAQDVDRCFVLPENSAKEAARLPSASVKIASHLLEVCAFLSGQQALAEPERIPFVCGARAALDMKDVRGQLQARRALEVAAAGRHHLLMVGPPGTGKSMLAQRLSGILPKMTETEAIASAMIQSMGSSGFDLTQFGLRPFRAPHHTSSPIALVGGGSNPKPGEISLAHHGVLFLDELTEFDRKTLEILREPLESHQVIISRAARQVEYPANFQLVAAMNPCPCGYLGHSSGRCRCSENNVLRYRQKISGPLMDRIDLLVEVGSVDHDELMSSSVLEDSQTVQKRVEAAYGRQIERQGKPNAALLVSDIERYCEVDEMTHQFIRQAMSRLQLSARAYHRILKVGRTIADLDNAEHIAQQHVAEAIQYRRQFH